MTHSPDVRECIHMGFTYKDTDVYNKSISKKFGIPAIEKFSLKVMSEK